MTKRMVPLLAAAAMLPAVSVQAATTTVSLAYYHASGDYGLDSDTDTDTVPLTIRYEDGPWSAGMSVPWVRISGFGTVIMTSWGPMAMSSAPGQGMYSSRGSGRYRMGSGMSAATTTATTVRVTESGLGDISVFAGYTFSGSGRDGFAVTVTATVKFATGDEDKGLGSGGTDYGAELGIEKPLGDFTPFLTAGYVVTGDNGAISYNDYPYLSVGTDYAIGRDLSAGLAWNYSASLSDDTDDSRDISANLSWQANDRWTAAISAGIGLTDSSPDQRWGIEIGYSF